MKALRIILIVLIVLVGGYAIWMATIEPEYHVKRTAIIEAEPEQVYATVSDFKTWKDWSKWHKMDPEMEVTYGDKSAGEGATYSWKGEEAGAGTQTITAAVPNESLETHIAFEGRGESDGYWKFEPVDEGTQVTWGFTGEMPFLYLRIFLGMDESVGGDFEEGLANLKEKVESMPVAEKAVS
ncbi:MAG: SRPBCC family protein [Owenweeksia sp.]|nr:SRPBCC family protein [Owenweeksia sp.]